MLGSGYICHYCEYEFYSTLSLYFYATVYFNFFFYDWSADMQILFCDKKSRVFDTKVTVRALRIRPLVMMFDFCLYVPLENFSTHMETSPLPVKGCNSAFMAIDQ